jgi:hypothetical protein
MQNHLDLERFRARETYSPQEAPDANRAPRRDWDIRGVLRGQRPGGRLRLPAPVARVCLLNVVVCGAAVGDQRRVYRSGVDRLAAASEAGPARARADVAWRRLSSCHRGARSAVRVLGVHVDVRLPRATVLGMAAARCDRLPEQRPGGCPLLGGRHCARSVREPATQIGQARRRRGE